MSLSRYRKIPGDQCKGGFQPAGEKITDLHKRCKEGDKSLQAEFTAGLVSGTYHMEARADSKFAPSQWEMALLCNDISHWLGANLELALEPQTKGTPLLRSWHFQSHFLEWKLWYFASNFIEVCSKGSNRQWVSIDSHNGWVLTRYQAMSWTNDGLFYWGIDVHVLLGPDKLHSALLISNGNSSL